MSNGIDIFGANCLGVADACNKVRIGGALAEFTKPVVACVVGRWKARLTRAVGHAGAMAGGSDDAAGKERWFMEKFGVDGVFTPENPIFSAKGAVVVNIAHIPMALTAVMRENATRPDFAAEGTLALKPWFGSSQGLPLPSELDIPVVEATAPYNELIAALSKQIGAVLPRQTMKDCSGTSYPLPPWAKPEWVRNPTSYRAPSTASISTPSLRRCC